LRPLDLDAITYEVIKHRLWQINDEQGITIRAISTSTIVVEGNDFNVGLFTKNGDLAVAGPYVTSHVTTMDALIKNVIALVGDDVADGDMFLCNDPYMGALHQNDAAVVSPLFVDGELILWVGNVLHHVDLGGIDEGSFCINATNVFQEAPRYFLKIARGGVIARDVEHTFIANSRLPDMVALDLRAQIGAINVARRRLHELIDQRGAETVLAVMTRTVDLAEVQLRERIAELPDGSWSTEVYMDGDRVGSDLILTVRLRLEKVGDQLLFDYTGSSPQSEGAVNATDYATYAGTTTPVYTFLCGGEIDWNSSIRRCVQVNAPEGTVMNARFPAAVSICSIGFTWLAAVAAMRVIAEMLSESEKYRDRVCPSWGVSCCGNNVFARNPAGKLSGGLLSDHRGGGAAARPFADGLDHAGVIFSPLSFMSNVESQEWKFPFLYLFRQRLTDSGGPGMNRGGLTVLAAMTPYGTDEVVWKSQNTAGSDQSNAAGISGGYPGAGSQVSVVRATDVWDKLAQGRPPLSFEDLGGEVQHLATKSQGVLEPGDVFVFHPAGGGGFGDPLTRPIESVRLDVVADVVSRAAAFRHYGVIMTDAAEVDEVATAAERQRRRGERRRAQELEPSVPAQAGHGNGVLTSCPACGNEPANGSSPDGVRWTTPLREAGPWLAERWEGESPNFQLLHTACAACGALWDVTEVRTQRVDHAPEPVDQPV
jgi:N-methylhydantoinase B